MEKVTVPSELVVPVDLPVVPTCTMDDCVASFLVVQNQALAQCSSQLMGIRKWSE